MIDYYEELSLSRELDTKRIQEELVRLESLWHKREVNSPEKANKMLGLIIDAHKVFVSEASRRKYDSNLEISKKEPEDPDISRSKLLEKWTSQARMFFNDGQHDLAKTSIDRALNYVDSEFDNGDFFELAADIYFEYGDMRFSLEYINKAIITSPDWADYYIVKARIYERMSLVDQQYDKRQNDINECRNNLMHAVSKAKASGDTVIEGNALGMLAFSLYFHVGPDVELAEEYARRAEALGECVNSKRVLDDITEKMNCPIYNEAKKEEGYGNLLHLRKALELYESLGDWRDASERAEMCRTCIGQLEDEEVRRQQEEQRQHEEQARQAKAEAEERERRAQAELEVKRKKKEQTIKLVKIATPIVAAVVVVIVLINSFFIPNGKYHSALNLMKSGNYEEAIIAFRALNGFRNSERKIDECYDGISQKKYDVAVELMNDRKYEEAITAFDALGDYDDSALQASSCKEAILQLQYEAAVGLMDEGKYEEAIAIFEKIGDYEDSTSFVAESQDAIKQKTYDAAVVLMKDGKYNEAIAAFDTLGDFSDSRIKIEKCEISIKQQSYDKALELISSQNYKEAYDILISLGDFSDSNEKINYLMKNTYLPLVLADVGSVVTFGAYEQDNDEKNGKEPIEWIVIKKDNDRLLLISQYILDSYYYNDYMESVTWLTCSARSWLNDTFFNEAFASDEKQKIMNIDVMYSSDGSTTTDKIFFLSKEEAFEYLEKESDRTTIATEYAIQQDEHLLERPMWMLRTNGKGIMEDYIDDDGTYTYYGNSNDAGVRPVIWLDL